MASLTLFPLEFQRQANAPVDIDSVFTSTTALNDHLSSPRRYGGQVVGESSGCIAYVLDSSKAYWTSLGVGGGAACGPATPTVLGLVYGCTCNDPYGGTSLGYLAGQFSFGNGNIAIGNKVLPYVCEWWNTGIGNFALCNNYGGRENVAIGDSALCANSSYGYRNMAIGTCALAHTDCCVSEFYTCCDASDNIAVGHWAHRLNIYGKQNVSFGAYTFDLSGYGSINDINLGFGASSCCNTVNVTTLGYGITCIRAQISTLTSISDCRDKTNICSIPVGLEFMKAVRPVKFEWNMRGNSNNNYLGYTEPGFIAQELDEIVQQFNAEWMALVNKDNPDKYEATIGKLLPVAIKSIQELSVIISSIEERLGIT